MNYTEAFRREYHPTNRELADDEAEAERIDAAAAAIKLIREKAMELYAIAQNSAADHLIDDRVCEAAEALAIECGAL